MTKYFIRKTRSKQSKKLIFFRIGGGEEKHQLRLNPKHGPNV